MAVMVKAGMPQSQSSVELNRPVSIQVVETEEGFCALAAEWSDLLERMEPRRPFWTPEWLTAWWQAFGAGTSLFIITIRSGEELVGIAPLMKRRWLGITRLEWIGAGRSDYLDFITVLDRVEIMRLVASFLVERKNEWDLLNLTDVSLEDGMPEKWAEVVEALELKVIYRAKDVCPYLTLQGTWDEHLSQRSKNHRKRLRKEERFLEEGPVETVFVPDFDSKDPRIGTILEGTMRIESKSWKFRKGSPRIQTDAASKMFYEGFLKSFAERCWLNTWFLLYENKPIAYAINFRYGGRAFAYNSAFDEAYQELGAGSLLHLLRIRNAFQEGLKEYDFLRGEESYKQQWTSTYRNLYQVAIANRSAWRSRWALVALRFRWFLAKHPILVRIRIEVFGWLHKMKRQWKTTGRETNR